MSVEEPPAGTAWDKRSIIGSIRGLPWWGAVLLAFGVASIAAWIDIQRQDSLGRIYQGAYILGCVVAMCWVRRRNLFGPMVQPPLVFAITAITTVALSESGSLLSSGLRQLIFSVALPLTSNFPTMAITSGVVLVIALLRLLLQRDPAPRIRSTRPARNPADPPDARPARATEPGAAPRDGSRPRSRRPRADQEPTPGARGPRRADRPGRVDPAEGWEPTARPTRDRTPRGDRSRSNPPPDRGRRGTPEQPRRPSRRRPPEGDYR